MSKIKILPAHEAQKIAAGEVIERPAHIIKELLENALDAQATKIDIYLEQAGKKLIRIVDNGHGMTADDARLCFIKHATSKVSSLDDLEGLNTFGFRGEALASIAAVSKTTLKTKASLAETNLELGISIDYEQGQITQEQAIACQKGTEFLVHDLFYNMPARRKFLRQDETEVNQVQQLIYAASLSHLNVSFKFHCDGRLALNAPACSSLLERITQLWGYNTTQNLVPLTSSSITTKHSWVSVSGAISQSSFWRHGRDRIFLFANNRWIKDPELSKAILKGYAGALPSGKFPMAFVFLSLDPGFVDINVHPKKEEVRFLKPGVVEGLLQKSIQLSLEEQVTQTLTTTQKNHHAAPQPQEVMRVQQEILESHFDHHSPHNNAPLYQGGDIEVKRPTLPPFFVPRQEFAPFQSIQQPLASEKKEEVNASFVAKETAASYTIIGQLFNTYIVLEKPDECLIIDQHAAHERILYEQWKHKFEGLAGVSLLFPEVITIPELHLSLIMQAQDIFANIGITLEQFGKQELIIKSSPPKITNTDLGNIIREAGVFLEDHETLDPQDLRKRLYEHMHSHMACKAAVRAGDALTESMMKQLIEDLLTVENRFQCVHGRPTMWNIPKNDFEKKFRRC